MKLSKPCQNSPLRLGRGSGEACTLLVQLPVSPVRQTHREGFLVFFLFKKKKRKQRKKNLEGRATERKGMTERDHLPAAFTFQMATKAGARAGSGERQVSFVGGTGPQQLDHPLVLSQMG